MPLGCGWMYANQILPTAAEWALAMGADAGRLSGLYPAAPRLDAIGSACMAFSNSRAYEPPTLDLGALADKLSELRSHHVCPAAGQQPGTSAPQQNHTAAAAAAAPAAAPAAAAGGTGCGGDGVKVEAMCADEQQQQQQEQGPLRGSGARGT